MRYLAALGLLLLLATPTQGVAFLKISGVTGGSVDARHAGEMDILSWSSSAVATQSIGSAGAGKIVLKDIKIRKHIDRATPQLFALTVTVKRSQEAIITERRGTRDYFTVRLTDVVVTGIAELPTSGPAGTPPDEELSLRFVTYEVSFTPQKADGSLDTPICSCWNKLTASGCTCRTAG